MIENVLADPARVTDPSPLPASRHNVMTPSKNRNWTKVGLMLGLRQTRWPNIKPTLNKCFVFMDSRQIFITEKYNINCIDLIFIKIIVSFLA